LEAPYIYFYLYLSLFFRKESARGNRLTGSGRWGLTRRERAGQAVKRGGSFTPTRSAPLWPMPRPKHTDTPLLSAPEGCETEPTPEGLPGTVVVTEGDPQPGFEIASVTDAAQRASLHALVEEDRALEAVVTSLRLSGYSVKDVAAGLGLSEARVRRVQRRARLGGKMAGFIEQLREDARVLAHEGLIEKLEAGDWDAIQKTMHGFGDFRTHSAQQAAGAHAPGNDLTVNIVMPPAPLILDPKNIVGQPRTLEVCDATVSAREIEGAEPQAVRPGEAGEIVGVRSAGENEGGELRPPAGARSVIERLEAVRTRLAEGAAFDETVDAA